MSVITNVANSSELLFAFEQELPSGDVVLSMTISPLVKPHHRCYRPIREYMSKVCATVISENSIPNPAWSGGRTIFIDYEIHRTCPGNEVDHGCSIKEGHGGGNEEA